MSYYKSYEYRVPKKIGFLLLFFFGFAGVTSIPKALHNDKPLRIKNLITLSPEIADWFWILFVCMCLVFVVLGLVIIIKSFQDPNYVIVEDEQISFPKKPISNNIITLKYNEIHKVKLENIGKQHTLSLFTDYGKCVLSSQSFDNIDKFNEVVAFIENKVNS